MSDINDEGARLARNFYVLMVAVGLFYAVWNTNIGWATYAFQFLGVIQVCLYVLLVRILERKELTRCLVLLRFAMVFQIIQLVVMTIHDYMKFEPNDLYTFVFNAFTFGLAMLIIQYRIRYIKATLKNARTIQEATEHKQGDE